MDLLNRPYTPQFFMFFIWFFFTSSFYLIFSLYLHFNFQSFTLLNTLIIFTYYPTLYFPIIKIFVARNFVWMTIAYTTLSAVYANLIVAYATSFIVAYVDSYKNLLVVVCLSLLFSFKPNFFLFVLLIFGWALDLEAQLGDCSWASRTIDGSSIIKVEVELTKHCISPLVFVLVIKYTSRKPVRCTKNLLKMKYK